MTPGAVGAAEVFVGAVGGWGPAEAVIVVEGHIVKVGEIGEIATWVKWQNGKIGEKANGFTTRSESQ